MDKYSNNGIWLKRLPSLDLLRFLAIIMMIQGHTLNEVAQPSFLNIDVFPWNIWHFVRGLTAPVFMMISGIVHVFASKRDESGFMPNKVFLKRMKNACLLIFIGYFMLMPLNNLFKLYYYGSDYWIAFFQTNILHIIGISQICILMMFKFIKKEKVIGVSALFIALFITFVSWYVQMIDWYSFMPFWLAPYFSYKYNALFGIFPFSAFVFYGVAIGTYMKSMEFEERRQFILKYSFPAGAAIVILGVMLFYLYSNFTYPYCDPLKVSPGTTILRVGIVLMLLPLVTKLYTWTSQFSKFYTLLGRRSLFIYVTHLLILYGSAFFPGVSTYYSHKLTLIPSFACAFTVIAGSMLLAIAYDYSVKKAPNSKFVYATVLLFTIFILNLSNM